LVACVEGIKGDGCREDFVGLLTPKVEEDLRGVSE